MKRLALLTLAPAILWGQDFEFIGHRIACDNGYVLFAAKSGDLIRTTGAVECEYYDHYRWWKVYAQEAGGHPAHVMAIEPYPEAWEYYNYVRPALPVVHKSLWRRIFSR